MRRTYFLLLFVLLCTARAQAQPAQAGDQPVEEQHRAGHALLQATIINGFYGLANLIRGQDTAKITPQTWWTNMKRGWEWDLDDFVVNQIGHPATAFGSPPLGSMISATST